MQKQKNYFINTYHHLYNRGANRNKIFFGNTDYENFLQKLKRYKDKYMIQINCYCLLPNHFHLFVKQLTKEYSIGKFIGDLTNSYTRTVNIKYERSGVLFEGKTKSKIINDESYFLWLCKYILNNPVKALLVKKPEDWQYSSAKEYFGEKDVEYTSTFDILNRFNNIESFKDFINQDTNKFDYSILF